MDPVLPGGVPQPDPEDQIRSLMALRDRPEELQAAAEQFEALLLGELLKPLRDVSAGLGQSMGSRFARDLFHQSVARQVAGAGGTGVAEMVVDAVRRGCALGAYGASAAPDAPSFLWPVPGYQPKGAGSGFGMRADPFTGAQKMHEGLDIGAPEGTPVFPVQGGTVTFAGERGGYGNLVIVDHGSGLTSRYGHLAAIHVAVGQRLDEGRALGDVGSTGRSTGPHLHLEIRRGGRAVDPAPHLHDGAKDPQVSSRGTDEPAQTTSETPRTMGSPATLVGADGGDERGEVLQDVPSRRREER